MKMTKEDEIDFAEAITCHICEQEFNVCDEKLLQLQANKLKQKRIDGMELQNSEDKKISKKGKRIVKESEKEKNLMKVRDHDHYNGKYRGAAHYICNLNVNFTHYKIPVFLHNLKGYDEHLIINSFGKYGKYIIKENIMVKDEDGNEHEITKEEVKEMKLECIPSSMEKYLTMRIGSMQFKDSFGFLSSSLETLADT